MDNKEMVSRMLKNNRIKDISFSRISNGFNNFWYEDDEKKLCHIPLSYEDTIDVLGGCCLNVRYTY